MTHSRRWAACPLVLDSMKVARHTRATYGVLRVGHRAMGGISRHLHMAISDQAKTGAVAGTTRAIPELKNKNKSSLLSHNCAHKP